MDYVKSQAAQSSAGNSAATYNIFLARLSCLHTLHRDDLPDMERGVELQECSSLLSNPDIESVNWLELAADQGSLEARLMYADSSKHAVGPPEVLIRHPERIVAWKARSMAYLEAAALGRNADAISSLSDAYGRGILVAPDPLREYAYLLASSQITPSPYSAQLLHAKAAHLSRAQRVEATALSRKIVMGRSTR